MVSADSESVYTKRHQNSTGRAETWKYPPDRYIRGDGILR